MHDARTNAKPEALYYIRKYSAHWRAQSCVLTSDVELDSDAKISGSEL